MLKARMFGRLEKTRLYLLKHKFYDKKKGRTIKTLLNIESLIIKSSMFIYQPYQSL